MTRTEELGRSGSRSRTRCRSRRRTRLRTTALPTALLTTKPTRGARTPESGWSASSRCTTRVRVPARRPRRRAGAKCRAEVSRCSCVSTQFPCGSPWRQTDRPLRPLRRRAERIDRPARVRIRSRKPCTLCRRRLFGWYVRLLTSSLRVGSRQVSGTGFESAGTAHPRDLFRGHAAPVDTVRPPNGTACNSPGSNRARCWACDLSRCVRCLWTTA